MLCLERKQTYTNSGETRSAALLLSPSAAMGLAGRRPCLAQGQVRREAALERVVLALPPLELRDHPALALDLGKAV